MAGKSRPKPALDVDALTEAARLTLERDKAVARTKLGPPAARPEVERRLQGLGFESTPKGIRVPLDEQLEAVLNEGSFVPVKKIAIHVRGATAAEAAKAAAALVERNVARRILRAKIETIVPAKTAVLAGHELATASKRASEIAKLLLAATSKGQGWGVLVDDARQAIEGILPSRLHDAPPVEAPRSSGAPRDRVSRAPHREAISALDRVLDAIDATRDPSVGLSFVPHVVRALSADLDAAVVKKTLLEGASRGLLELRPEGGLGRLSREELSACPEGPQGSRLSWARRMEGTA